MLRAAEQTGLRISGGVFRSKWYGVGDFRELFDIRVIGRVVRHTVVISLLRLTFGFFPPIVLAIFLYDLHLNALRRVQPWRSSNPFSA